MSDHKITKIIKSIIGIALTIAMILYFGFAHRYAPYARALEGTEETAENSSTQGTDTSSDKAADSTTGTEGAATTDSTTGTTEGSSTTATETSNA